MKQISFRITHSDLKDPNLVPSIADHYHLNIYDYITLKLKTDIVQSSMGVHLEASEPHIHYHMVVENFKFPANVNQSWKYFWLKQQLNAKSPMDTPMVFREKGKKMINISIKMTEPEELLEFEYCHLKGALGSGDSPSKFLAYPLKENLEINEYCKNIEIKRLKDFAHSLYVEAKERAKKAAAIKEDKLSKYEAYCYHMDERLCSEFQISDKYDRGTQLRLFFKEQIPHDKIIPFVSLETDLYYFNQIRATDAKEHIHPKQIVYNMEKYLFAAGHYSVASHFRY